MLIGITSRSATVQLWEHAMFPTCSWWSPLLSIFIVIVMR